MKTFKFIVINKNDMTKIAHFATADRVGAYLLGKKLTNILILVNEETILNLKDVPTNGWLKIERILNELAIQA